jgi:catechol 2,3-dioxygenase-like lactoylglutathione lyase family enzyme
MRLDHIAYRSKDRKKTSKFFIDAFGYKIQQEFQLQFDDGTTADCIALEPPEKVIPDGPWTIHMSKMLDKNDILKKLDFPQEYHLAPEIFVSDGVPNSIVAKWVEEHGPGIHHLAYQVDDVEAKMKEWREKGYAEFSTDEPIRCDKDKLVQVFSQPSDLTGIVYEFIKRGKHGFCQESVKALMWTSR